MRPSRAPISFRHKLVNALLYTLPIVIILFILLIADRTFRHWETPIAKNGALSASLRLDSCMKDLKQKVGPQGQIAVVDIDQCIIKSAENPSLDSQIKTRVDDLKWTLTMIGSIGAFFVIAQSAAAFFSAVLYTSQAQSKLDEIDEIHKGIEERYPVFREVERRRKGALLDLESTVKISSKSDTDPFEILDYEYKDKLYRGMSVEKRQELLSIESFASIDLDAGPSGGDNYAANLRRLAYFYQSKFKHESSGGFGSMSDLERAEGYLILAVDKSKGDFAIYNDLGVLRLDMLKGMKGKVAALRSAGEREAMRESLQAYREAAKKALDASIAREPAQIRAYFNLAILSAGYGDAQGSKPTDKVKKAADYQEAIRLLKKALADGQGNGNTHTPKTM